MSVDPRRSRCPSMSTGSRARRSLFRTASPSPSDGPDRRRLQLVRRANRDSQPDPEGPLRGGAGSRRVVLHARQRHAGPDPPPADHRHLPDAPLRPVCHRGLGKPPLPHPARRLRRHRPRHPPLVGLHPAVRHRPAYGADLLLRVVQAPARAELGDRRRPVRSGASDGDHRRLSSLGPGRLLDRRGGDQHCRLHALHRLLPPCALAWRRYRGADDAEPNLRHPCLAHTRHPVPTDRRPPGAAPQARRIRFLRQLSRRLSKPRRRRRPAGTKQRPIEPPYPAVPTDELWAAPLETEDFYPHQTFKDGVVSAGLVILVFILAVAIGAPLEAVADPATTSYTPVPEWFFLPLDELLLLVPQQLIPLVLVLPTGGVLLLLALPFIDRDPERNPFERPAVMVPGAFAVLFVVILTLLGSGRLFNL